MDEHSGIDKGSDLNENIQHNYKYKFLDPKGLTKFESGIEHKLLVNEAQGSEYITN